jgi:hypothetical protein
MAIKAFIDLGYTEPETFCLRFLESPDFSFETLKKFINRPAKKGGLAADLSQYVIDGRINKDEILLEYAKQPRRWFTFKNGDYSDLDIVELEEPDILLTEFGQQKWYGPLDDPDEGSYYYFRVYSFPDYYEIDGEIKITKIRWVVIAKVNDTHISLNWNGFTLNTKDRIRTRNQFPFWQYIPDAFDELEEILELEEENDYPLFHDLILTTLWDRYISDQDYEWRHLAVRAEASGVALSARSAGIVEINVRGLEALANKLAESVINRDARFRRSRIKRAQSKIIKTLIKEWGTKSYEFKLEHNDEKIFRAHCYFGLKPDGTTQDCFPHFKSYQRFGGASKAIDFLIDEMNAD